MVIVPFCYTCNTTNIQKSNGLFVIKVYILQPRNTKSDLMHEPISNEQMFIIDQQKVVLQDLDAPGYILDIGGGGEGTIGVLKGEHVIAIDTRKEELEEAPEGPLKIVMDATNLQFLDNTFDTVTAFFTLMYIKRSDRKRVFKEIYRVLKPGGYLLIWDVVIPPKGDNVKEWFVVPVVITVHDKEIETGYGVKWEGREQDMSYCIELAEEVGFEIAAKEEHDQVFHVCLRK